ncbi:hypothetical protein [Mucilaginibacter sp. FT3.2]|uniref:hypothetical protein n=1 Tax=Mucilaginibacter sp. FT3.2 TaxID=2723090 RepID=UPI001619F824|nr:hypothetical protein [Mucilaginibacter sp. FT3.2]MBB6231380.1 hypothetical protein [Mucilaginibacter sp. FT3.2]
MHKTLLSLFFIITFNNLQAQEIIEQFLGIDQFPNKFIIANQIVRRDDYEYRLNRKGIPDSTYIGALNFNYNKTGQLTDIVHFDKENFLDNKYVYWYYDFGLISKKIGYTYLKEKRYGKNFNITHEYGYDSIGRLEYNIFYNQDTLFVNKEKREYDAKGKLYRITKTVNKARPYISNIARYNDENNLETIDYFYEQNIDYSYSMQTDTIAGGGKIINITKIKPGEEDQYWCTYKFNRYNQCIEITGFDTVGLVKTRYTDKLVYNTDGTLYTSIFYINKKMNRMYKYYYHK